MLLCENCVQLQKLHLNNKLSCLPPPTLLSVWIIMLQWYTFYLCVLLGVAQFSKQPQARLFSNCPLKLSWYNFESFLCKYLLSVSVSLDKIKFLKLSNYPVYSGIIEYHEYWFIELCVSSGHQTNANVSYVTPYGSQYYILYNLVFRIIW